METVGIITAILIAPLAIGMALTVLALVVLSVCEMWAGVYWSIRRLVTGEKPEEPEIPYNVWTLGQ